MKKKTKMMAALFLALTFCLSSCSCEGCPIPIKLVIGDKESTTESGSETEDETTEPSGETDNSSEEGSSEEASGKESTDKESTEKGESKSKKENDESAASGGSKEKTEGASSSESTASSSSEKESTTASSSSEKESSTEPSSETAKAHTHTFTHVLKTDPTCTTDGNIEYWRCNECSKCYKDAAGTQYIEKPEDLVLKATGHKLTFHKGYVSTSCLVETTLGYFSCDVCGKRYLEEECKTEVKSDADLKVPGPHNPVHVAKVDASCEAAGNTEYWECSYCGKLFSDAECKVEILSPTYVVIYPLGHQFPLTYISFSYPTCTESGVKDHYECARCGKYFWDEDATLDCVPADTYLPASHSPDTYVPAKSASCGGIDEHYICSECGAWIAMDGETAWEPSAFYTSGSGMHDWQEVTVGGKKVYEPNDSGRWLFHCTKCGQETYMAPKG